MRIKYFHLNFSIIELILSTDGALDSLILNQSATFIFHVDNSRNITKIPKYIIYASVGVPSRYWSNKKHSGWTIFYNKLLNIWISDYSFRFSTNWRP